MKEILRKRTNKTKGDQKMSKNIKLSVTMILAILLFAIQLSISAAALDLNAPETDESASIQEQIVGVTSPVEELMATAATACWGSIYDGLNYYLGYQNYNYINGHFTSDGFIISVSGNTCSITGDDISYSFNFS